MNRRRPLPEWPGGNEEMVFKVQVPSIEKRAFFKRIVDI